MEQEIYNLWSLVLQIITSIAAVIVALWQIDINLRLKKLQDYVAVAIVPMPTGNLSIQIKNVGKINLYLQKYEIGTDHQAYARPMLIPAGSDSFLIIMIKNFTIGQNMDVKLYLIDELDEKFISTGEVTVNQLDITTGTPPQTVKVNNVSGWAYKTRKQNWTI